MTGVSGSGKSSLVNEVLYKAVSNRLHRSRLRPGAHKRVRGIEQLDKIISVDQSPIGRTPRSNPATYIGLFDQIRDLFSKTQEARARGYKPGRFSFNVKGGRCEVCRGDGQIKIEMHFLPDVYVPCEQCHGKRYNRETLDIRFKGKTIADVLDMPIEEALDFFAHIPKIKRRVQALHDVGLDYMRLGQPATTLSGGEAQRVKLASELSKVATGKTLYILDEPTTGLHFADIQRLLEVLQRLVDQGNSVVVIEHNLDVIKTADRIIDMGPEGGEEGGELVASGTPEEVAAIESSYTGQFLADIVEPKRRGPGGRRGARRSRPPRERRRLAAQHPGPARPDRGGTLLILIGLGVIGGFLGVLLLILGAIPIASAAYGALLVGPLLGRDTMGRRPEDQPEEDEAGLGRRRGGRGARTPEDEDILRRRPGGRPGLERTAARPRERPEGQEPRDRATSARRSSGPSPRSASAAPARSRRTSGCRRTGRATGPSRGPGSSRRSRRSRRRRSAAAGAGGRARRRGRCRSPRRCRACGRRGSARRSPTCRASPASRRGRWPRRPCRC